MRIGDLVTYQGMQCVVIGFRGAQGKRTILVSRFE